MSGDYEIKHRTLLVKLQVALKFKPHGIVGGGSRFVVLVIKRSTESSLAPGFSYPLQRIDGLDVAEGLPCGRVLTINCIF